MSFLGLFQRKNFWISTTLSSSEVFRRLEFDCLMVAKSLAWLVASDVGSIGPFSPPVTHPEDSPFFAGDWLPSYKDALSNICTDDAVSHDVAIRLGFAYMESLEQLTGCRSEMRQILSSLKKARYRADAFFSLSLSFFWQISMARNESSGSVVDSLSGSLALMNALKDGFMPEYISAAKEIQRVFRA